MNDQMVIRYGKLIELRSGQNFIDIINTISIPNQQSSISILPQTEEIIFISQTGIKKSSKIRPDKKIILSTTNLLKTTIRKIKISSNQQLFIIPPMNSTRQVSIINASNYDISYLIDRSNLSIALQVTSPVIVKNQNYYFSNGLSYSNTSIRQQYIYFYEGYQNNYKNIFNFTIPANSRGTLLYPTQYLQNIEQNGINYFLLVKQMDTNRLSFEVISKIGDIYESMGVSDSNIVSGIKLLNKDKIIYYSTSYCQLMQLKISQFISNLPKNQAIDKNLLIISSQDDKTLVGFSTSIIFNKMYIYAYILQMNQNSTYKLTSQLKQNKGGVGFESCQFFMNGQYIGIRQGTNLTGYYQLSFYSIINKIYIQDYLYQVDDYSLCPNSNLIFIRTNTTLMAYRFQNQKLILITTTIIRSRSILNFTCGWDQSIFIFHNIYPYPFQKWQLRNQILTKVAQFNRDSLNAYYFKTIFEDCILFKGLSIGLYFFDYNLNSFTVEFNEYKYIQPNEIKGNFIFFLNNYATSPTYSILYEYKNRTLIKKGYYPVSINSQNVIRRLILSSRRQIFLDYYNNILGKYESIRYSIDDSPQMSIGYIYDETQTQCYIGSIQFTNNNLQMIGITQTINRYSIANLSLIDSGNLNNFKTIYDYKISTSQKHICIWGQSIDNNKYFQIRLMNNLQNIIYQKILNNINKQNILDCQINTLQNIAILTFQLNTYINLYLYDNNFNDIKIQQFIKITAMSVCRSNSYYAYTGINMNNQSANYIILDNLKIIMNSTKIQCDCIISLITFSQNCDLIAYTCTNYSLYVYNITSSTIFFNKNLIENILKIQILLDNKILVTTLSSILIFDIINTIGGQIQNLKQLKIYPNSSIAIDYINQLIAYTSDLKSISVTDFTGVIIDNILNKDGLDVIALTFKNSGQLYVSLNGSTSNAISSVVIWSNQVCPQNQTILNNYCVCLDTFVLINGSCICLNNQIIIDGVCGCKNNLSLLNDTCGCRNNLIIKNDYCVCDNNLILINDSCGCQNNLILKNNFCVCDNNLVLVNNICVCLQKYELVNNQCQCRGDLIELGNNCGCEQGYIQLNNYICQKCSFTCSQCNDGGIFSCKQFSVWFYLIISGCLLLIIGVVIVIVVRLKKSKGDSSQLQSNTSQSKDGTNLLGSQDN